MHGLYLFCASLNIISIAEGGQPHLSPSTSGGLIALGIMEINTSNAEMWQNGTENNYLKKNQNNSVTFCHISALPLLMGFFSKNLFTTQKCYYLISLKCVETDFKLKFWEIFWHFLKSFGLVKFWDLWDFTKFHKFHTVTQNVSFISLEMCWFLN